MITGVEETSRLRLMRALESVDDAIELLQWRYEAEAESSITRLQRLRDDLLVAHALLAADDGRMH